MSWLLAKRAFSHSDLRVFLTSIRKLHPRSISLLSDPVIQPLRILFCGSDDFSAESLKRLHKESQNDSDFIASIDVVCKRGKPAGRGMRKIRDVPIKQLAEELDLPLHEIPTFTGWTPPQRDNMPINLIIAVSFGLLVPARLLDGAAYGGLNLHPSLLPELRGSAPLQHTILLGLKESGVSLQTLHPAKFDHGIILAQSCFDLPTSVCRNIQLLRQFMSSRAANLLIESLRRRVYLLPDKPAIGLKQRPGSHAPKITTEQAHISWSFWTAIDILRHQSAMGPVWSIWKYMSQKHEKQTLRIQWHDLRIIDTNDSPLDAGRLSVVSENRSMATDGNQRNQVGGIWTKDGNFVSPACVTIEGRKKGWPGNSVQMVEYLLSLTSLGQAHVIQTSNSSAHPSLC